MSQTYASVHDGPKRDRNLQEIAISNTGIMVQPIANDAMMTDAHDVLFESWTVMHCISIYSSVCGLTQHW